MVAARALSEVVDSRGTDAELRAFVPDLVALSSLPALWIKADAWQIVDSLGQLAVSLLDLEFACVFLRDPNLQAVHRSERSVAGLIDPLQVRRRYRANARFELDDEKYG